MRRLAHLTPALIAALALASPAAAHIAGPHAEHGGFAAGVMHPVTGLDHVLAMVAVGLLAARLGGRALWSLPLTFVAVMSVAAAAGAARVGLPFVEPGIAASILVLGLAVAGAGKLPQAAALGLCALFAVFHGHAHGTELAEGASFGAYLAGFAIATTALHGAGIAAGLGAGNLLARREETAARWTWGVAGSSLALAGVLVFAGVL